MDPTMEDVEGTLREGNSALTEGKARQRMTGVRGESEELRMSSFARTFRSEQLQDWDVKTYGEPVVHSDGLLRYEGRIFIPTSRVRWF